MSTVSVETRNVKAGPVARKIRKYVSLSLTRDIIDVSSRIRMYSNSQCGIPPNRMTQAVLMTTTNTRFGNIGNMKSGLSVWPWNAVCKLRSACDAVALEANTVTVTLTTRVPEKQVRYLGSYPSMRVSSLAAKVGTKKMMTAGLAKTVSLQEAVSVILLSYNRHSRI
jgi:hypothetical protein